MESSLILWTLCISTSLVASTICVRSLGSVSNWGGRGGRASKVLLTFLLRLLLLPVLPMHDLSRRCHCSTYVRTRLSSHTPDRYILLTETLLHIRLAPLSRPSGYGTHVVLNRVRNADKLTELAPDISGHDITHYKTHLHLPTHPAGSRYIR